MLTPVCILLASAAIYYSYHILEVPSLIWIVLGATFAHISSNLFNEYLDFKSGLDFKTQKTPFSGGSGALPSDPNSAKSVLNAAIATLILTSIAGVYLLYISYVRSSELNLSLLLIGLLGLILILIYTGPVNRSPWLCLISPGIGFGLLMIYGTSSVLLGYLSAALLPAALLIFLMVNNLLLLNQLPDLEADRSIGRKHIWIVKGESFGVGLYLFITLLVPLLFLSAILCKIWPVSSWLSLIPWCLTFVAWKGAKTYGTKIAEHPQFLAMNVLATLCVPFILSIILFISA
tara:strand:- start:176 stop:1045 length:870 start_codon:yes stop_codon:yes gene_type:complete